jgi:uncharacterized protein DUF5658
MDDLREGTVSMDHTRHKPSLERRHLANRWTRPTTLWSALRWQGRRHGCRCAGEGRHVYVDCLVWRSVGLALLVVGGSALDGCLTLLHLDDGGSDANPLMHLALALAPTVFVALKLCLTGVAVWWLAAHQRFPLADRSLHGFVLGYGAVLVSHLMLSLHLV